MDCFLKKETHIFYIGNKLFGLILYKQGTSDHSQNVLILALYHFVVAYVFLLVTLIKLPEIHADSF